MRGEVLTTEGTEDTAQRSRNPKTQSSLLGLVQGIVKMHRGRVEASSALGRGTVFSVHLPALGAGGTLPRGNDPVR